jgi:threonine synthase
MKFVSTRGAGPVTIREALEAGLAPDGGLFVPTEFPHLGPKFFDNLTTLPEFGKRLLGPFFADDPGIIATLGEICDTAFDFPTLLRPVPGRPKDFILELFHGPTCAFKDVGARFLARVTAPGRSVKMQTVIVATSGDTGGAVAAAFHKLRGVEVVILFPKGKVSPRQEHQLCAWGDNIRAFAVEGDFDSCQRIVKEALLDSAAERDWRSANSINLGRVLPQMVYYAQASILRKRLNPNAPDPGFIIPSGNLGNALAALWAKKIGLPIGPIVLSLNANRVIADFLKTGVYAPAPTIATTANAMDVGNPSNLERLRALYPNLEDLRADVRAESVSDDEIRNEIRTSEVEWGQVLCPHTATAAVVRRRLAKEPDFEDREWILVSTAHPAKFETIVEPLVGHAVELPGALKEILRRKATFDTIAPTYAALLARL